MILEWTQLKILLLCAGLTTKLSTLSVHLLEQSQLTSSNDMTAGLELMLMCLRLSL